MPRLPASSAASIFAPKNINSHPFSFCFCVIIFLICALEYSRLEFSIPSVMMTKSTRLSAASIPSTFCMRLIVSPTASSSAVLPPATYCLEVSFFTFFRSVRSWMTLKFVSKSTVVTFALTPSFFCSSIIELKPPIVSLSSPLIEPDLSSTSTSSRCFSGLQIYFTLRSGHTGSAASAHDFVATVPTSHLASFANASCAKAAPRSIAKAKTIFFINSPLDKFRAIIAFLRNLKNVLLKFNRKI